ncbi:MAG: hypothetical protein LBD67_04280 [Candidatus Accumulibacter sp.]|jgi:hypothetical protein|nr:hypothetical protein [Accumulibacter sp.]
MNGRSAFPVLTLSSNSFSILTLRQASFDKLWTEQGERIEKQTSDKLDGRTD